MVILGKRLSDKCAQLVKSAIDALSVDVYFRDIKETNRNMYGSTDVSHYNDGYCTIYLQLEQSPIQFETTMLHELRHIWQIEKGYPLVVNKNACSFFNENPYFFETIGSQIQSAILDLDVIDYLEDNGYSSTLFSDFARDREALSVIWQNVTKESLKDPWNLATAVLALYVAYVRADEVNKPIVQDSASQFPQIIQGCKIVEKAISPEACSDPVYCANRMGWIIDHFSLWKTYYVEFRGERIRTHGEYVNRYG